jgi:hypothetical protein
MNKKVNHFIRSFKKLLSNQYGISDYLENSKLDYGKYRIQLALSRAAATAGVRRIDHTAPWTWEFSGFSQNGEDGIIDFLISQLNESNKYFIEIGASNGLENNTSWLAMGKRFSGLMIDADTEAVNLCRKLYEGMNWGLRVETLKVNLDNVEQIKNWATHSCPDVLSLDIDSNDFYIMGKLFDLNIKPKIAVVEYNSAFGPDESCTIEYSPEFNLRKVHAEGLFYGVSLAGWKTFFSQNGYRFVTVDSNGVNAFFVDPVFFASSFIENLQPREFAENFAQFFKDPIGWRSQNKKISHLNTKKINK